MKLYDRMGVPRGMLAGTVVALGLVWGVRSLTGGGYLSALVQSGVYLALVVVTARSRRAKVLVVRTAQRYTLNPVMRLLLHVGLNPLGLALSSSRPALPREPGASRLPGSPS